MFTFENNTVAFRCCNSQVIFIFFLVFPKSCSVSQKNENSGSQTIQIKGKQYCRCLSERIDHDEIKQTTEQQGYLAAAQRWLY